MARSNIFRIPNTLFLHRSLTSINFHFNGLIDRNHYLSILSNQVLTSLDGCTYYSSDRSVINEIQDHVDVNQYNLRERQHQFLFKLICIAGTSFCLKLIKDIWILIFAKLAAECKLGKAQDQTHLVVNSIFNQPQEQIKAAVKTAHATKSSLKMVINRDANNKEIASLRIIKKS